MARNFTKDFKTNAVNLVLKRNLKIATVAHQLDINVQTLYRWIDEFKELGEDAFVGKGHISTENIEIRKLKKQVEDLKTENEILKKAQAYFIQIKKKD